VVMLGVGRTVKATPLLATPFSVTTTFPVVAPAGTGATIFQPSQLVGLAATPLKVTVVEPCVVPKLEPLIVTDVPTGPEVGDRVVILGVGKTVNFMPLLATPPTVTTTFPVPAPVGTGTLIVVAFQLVGVAAVPANVTVLEPCVEPKPAPVMVTTMPTGPVMGERLVSPGPASTVKVIVLLGTELSVTTTLPVVAPVGTGARICVALQLAGLAVVPLKVNVLVPCVAPKVVPVIVTVSPIGPLAGDRLEMLGVGSTVNALPLLATPVTVTTTLPVVAPVGTGTVMLVADQVFEVAAVPLNVIVLVPRDEPNVVPVMVTISPMP